MAIVAFVQRMTMRRLLTHLAQLSSFYAQGELRCTQGLSYLLDNADGRLAFSDLLCKHTGFPLSADLTWRAEVRQPDGRPDLEAHTADGKPRVKIEAKLGAELGGDQLKSYMADLRQRSGGGLLLVLVPPHRTVEATAVASTAFARAGSGPWRLGDTSDSAVAVISWDEVLDNLRDVCSDGFACDLAQFREMYRVLKGDVVEPITDVAEVLAWREREGIFVHLVDRVTRRLTQDHKLAPMGTEPDGYQRRYVCRPFGTRHRARPDQESERAKMLGRASEGTEQPWPCFSLGTRDPFKAYITPIWLRFHKDTAKFRVIRDRLRVSRLSQGLVESGGHVWIPLDVRPDTDIQRQVDSLVAQAEDVAQVAYQPGFEPPETSFTTGHS